MSKPDAMRVLLDSFQSCKREDRSLAVFESEQIAARVERVLGVAREESIAHHPTPKVLLARRIVRLLDGEEP